MNARARISGSSGGAESDQVQREVARQVGEYRFKLQKADQDITNLQTAVSRAARRRRFTRAVGVAGCVGEDASFCLQMDELWAICNLRPDCNPLMTHN